MARWLAILVVLIACFQIAACAAGCTCSGDATQDDPDGCLCHHVNVGASVPVVMAASAPLERVPPQIASSIPEEDQSSLYRPPR